MNDMRQFDLHKIFFGDVSLGEPVGMATKAKGGRRTGVSEKQRFWKSAQEPHEKNELCLISWKSKFNDEYMVDFAWWYDGKWEGEAEFDPPDFWAPIPNPREANRSEQ